MTAQAISVAALWGATILYAVAMVAYAIRLAREADARVQTRRLVAVGANGESASGTAEPTVVRMPRSATRALGIARAATLVGFILNGIGVLARGIDAGHVPWSNMYELVDHGLLRCRGHLLGDPAQAGRDVPWRRHHRPRDHRDGPWADRALRRGRIPAAGPAVDVAADSRVRGDHLLRHLWRGVHRDVAAADQGLSRLRDAANGLGPWPRVQVHGGRAKGRRAGGARVPAHRGWLRAVDVHGHGRRHLGRARLGPLLGLGPQGGVELHHLGGLRRVSARAHHAGLGRAQVCLPGARRFWRAVGELHARELRLPGPAHLRAGQVVREGSAGAGRQHRQARRRAADCAVA